jgi:hypothetical protein
MCAPHAPVRLGAKIPNAGPSSPGLGAMASAAEDLGAASLVPRWMWSQRTLPPDTGLGSELI